MMTRSKPESKFTPLQIKHSARLIKLMSAKRSPDAVRLRDLLFGGCATLITAPSAPFKGTGIFLDGAETPPWKGGDFRWDLPFSSRRDHFERRLAKERVLLLEGTRPPRRFQLAQRPCEVISARGGALPRSCCRSKRHRGVLLREGGRSTPSRSCYSWSIRAAGSSFRDEA